MAKCKDHLGNEFESERQMYTHWGIPCNTADARLLRGWSLERTLTEPVHKKSTEAYDHLGRKFKSINDMCIHWGIPSETYQRRINKGLSVKEALTLVRDYSYKDGAIWGKKCTDHLGNEFNSKTAMCRYWGIPLSTFKDKTEKGFTLKDILEPQKIRHIDHLGNEFKSQIALCAYWNIAPSTFRFKLAQGISLKDILEPEKEKNIDHLGNEYESIEEMCFYWNVEPHIFKTRIKNGWSLKKALTFRYRSHEFPTSDIFGNSFYSINDMIRYYNLEPNFVRNRTNRGAPMSAALNIVPFLHRQKHNVHFRPNFYINKRLYEGIDKKEYWSCTIDGQEMILPKEEIYQRMEEIVREEYKTTGTVQTTES